jgi:hypothetical protein
MEPEPVRQFVSKAARCKARAAFELCAPDTRQRVKIPDVVLNFPFAFPVLAAAEAIQHPSPKNGRAAPSFANRSSLSCAVFCAYSMTLGEVIRRSLSALCGRAVWPAVASAPA